VRPEADQTMSFCNEKRLRLKQWLGILSLTLSATLLNPCGLRGAVYPFTIWSNYSAVVLENQSIPFLERNGYIAEYFVIKLRLVVLYLSFIAVGFRALRYPTALFALAALIGGMTWFAIRNKTIL